MTFENVVKAYMYTFVKLELQGQNIRIFHECEVRIEKSVTRVTVWLHVALPIDAKQYPRGKSLDQYLTLMIGTPMRVDT